MQGPLFEDWVNLGYVVIQSRTKITYTVEKSNLFTLLDTELNKGQPKLLDIELQLDKK